MSKVEYKPIIEEWCTGWIEGFLAAGYLFTKNFDRYDKLRDEYLSKRGNKDYDLTK